MRRGFAGVKQTSGWVQRLGEQIDWFIYRLEGKFSFLCFAFSSCLWELLSRVFTAGAFGSLQLGIISLKHDAAEPAASHMIRRVRSGPKGNTNGKRASTYMATRYDPEKKWRPVSQSVVQFHAGPTFRERWLGRARGGGVNAFYGFPHSSPLQLCDSIALR